MTILTRALPVLALAAAGVWTTPLLAADGKSQADPYANPAAKRSGYPVHPKVPEPPPPAKRVEAGKKGEAAKGDAAKPADPAKNPAAPVEAADVWSETEIAEAKARCDAVLKGVDYVAVPEPPMRSGTCGAPAPLQLVSIGKNPEVTFSPPPTLTCEMVKALDDWIKGDLQKLAKSQLGSPIIRIETMSSYSCRNAYGRAKTKLSEHGLANAIDIGGFVTATAVTTRVLGNWGLTAREIRARDIAAAKAAEEKLKAEKAAAEAASAAARSKEGQRASSGAASPVVRVEPPRSSAGREGFSIAPNHLGGPADKNAGATSAATPVKPEPPSRDQRFLRAAHATACRYFGTVLGPEANFAHHNHFHLDMAPRRSGNFCE